MCHSFKCPGGMAPPETEPEARAAWFEKYGDGAESEPPKKLTIAEQFGFCSPKRQVGKRPNEPNKNRIR
jgi:hypothetical protein